MAMSVRLVRVRRVPPRGVPRLLLRGPQQGDHVVPAHDFGRVPCRS